LIENPKQEWERLEAARDSVRAAIQHRRLQTAANIGESEAAIFDAHLMMLEDPELTRRARELIFDEKQNAALAWHTAIKEAVEAFQDISNDYLRERAADVADIGDQVLYALAGESSTAKILLEAPVILFAHDLTPSQTAQLDMEHVLGVATVAGGPTSHSAILARTMGIPAVAGVSADLDDLPEGTTVAMDGSRGRLWIDPSREVLATLSEHQRAWLERRAQALEASQEGAVTRDGRRIEVAANVGNAADARLAAKNGAEGIGLLRTEFLYLTRETPPTEEEQRQALAEIGEAMGSAPVIVRTLDVGGDKPLPYIQLPPEANPFLGVRAIRLSFKEIDLFKAQLRAILRAGVTANLRIMFPMVTGVGEVIHARDLLEQAHRALLSEGIPHQWPIETGIMVEIPSAALLSSPLADHVDFFSIGTNDLTQYTLAAERGNPALTELADGLHPAVLRLIRLVANSARAQGKWTGVCGELAGDLAAVPVLVGLGVDELSVNPGSVPEVKLLIRSLSMDRVEKLAESLLESESAQEARSLAVSFLEETRGR
jgi:phosphocarrier protein FPr